MACRMSEEQCCRWRIRFRESHDLIMGHFRDDIVERRHLRRFVEPDFPQVTEIVVYGLRVDNNELPVQAAGKFISPPFPERWTKMGEFLRSPNGEPRSKKEFTDGIEHPTRCLARCQVPGREGDDRKLIV